jgi:hypothetical protein
MVQLPEEITLHPSRKKWGFIFTICALLCSCGVCLIWQQPGVKAWAMVLFLAFGAAAGLTLLVSRKAYLTLYADRFEQSMLGRRLNYRWNQVSAFHVWQHQHHSVVCFDVVEDESVLGEMNRGLAGASGFLSDSFGLKADDLAELMNRFRDRSLMRSGEKPF